jgi:hypothetical protein
MKIWQKIIIIVAAVILIALFIHWWMSYQPMKIIVKNERNESVNVSIILLTVDDVEMFNKSILIEANESITLQNVTTWASAYYIKVTINDSNESIKKKIKYGKYYEVIEVIISKDGIEVRNERK